MTKQVSKINQKTSLHYSRSELSVEGIGVLESRAPSVAMKSSLSHLGKTAEVENKVK
jgi:hypothetical protein